MIVDLGKLEVGHTVKFRNGGEDIVARMEDSRNVTWITIWFEGYSDDSCRISRSKSGAVFGAKEQPFDIIEVIPKPFDWKDVKRGMAFRYRDNIVYYIAPNLNYQRWSVFETPGDPNCYNGFANSSLTRTPEYDKKVTK